MSEDKGDAGKEIWDVDIEKLDSVKFAEEGHYKSDGDMVRIVNDNQAMDYVALCYNTYKSQSVEDLTKTFEEGTRSDQPQKRGSSDEESEEPVFNLSLLEQSTVYGPPIFFLQKFFETPKTGVLEVRVRDPDVSSVQSQSGEPSPTEIADHIKEVFYRISMLENDEENHSYSYLVEVFVRSPDAMVTLLNRNRSQAYQDLSEDDQIAVHEYKNAILRKARTMKNMDTRLSFYESVNLQGCTKTVFSRWTIANSDFTDLTFATATWLTSDELLMDTTTQSDIQDLVFGILTDTVALQPKFIAACFDVEPHQPVSPTVLSADRADNITVDNAKKFSKDEQSRNKTKVQSVTADLPAKESETKRAEKKASKKSRFRRFLSNVFGCCVCGRRSH